MTGPITHAQFVAYLRSRERMKHRRASLWPLIRLVLLAFLVGVLVGLALSALSSDGLNHVNPEGVGLDPVPVTFHEGLIVASDGTLRLDGSGVHLPANTIDGSTVRAGGDRGRRLVGASEDRYLPTLSGGTSAPARTTSLDVRTDVRDIITSAATEFGVDPQTMLRVAFCESSFRPEIVGDGGRAVGIFQFHLPFWGEVAHKVGYTSDLRHDPLAASRVAAYAFSVGLAHRWTCR